MKHKGDKEDDVEMMSIEKQLENLSPQATEACRHMTIPASRATSPATFEIPILSHLSICDPTQNSSRVTGFTICDLQFSKFDHIQLKKSTKSYNKLY